MTRGIEFANYVFMTIPPRFKDEIRNRLTLSEIIGKRIKVTRAGREFKACCPFHHEKSPSFTINDDKQFYHCFGCGAHGDVIGFVMQHDGLPFPEAIEQLAALAGLQVPQQTPQEIEQAKKEKDLYTLMEDTTAYFVDTLYGSDGAVSLKYLEDRGLKRETLSAFRLGFAPADGQALRKHLAAKGYSDKQMIEAGVLKESSKRKEPYTFFRDRIMFPVADRRGRVVAFGGRILPDHLRPPDTGNFTPPKYMNSGDTPLFDKGGMLYGESLARQAAVDGQDVIVVEGYMDVIACHQAGLQGAVAPMGTALTERQVLALWKMIPDEEKVPILCFDGDNAGRGAAGRACERFLPSLKPYHSVRFAFMPDGEDPDSLIRNGGVAGFRRVLAGALSVFDFIWAKHTAGREFKTPESRAGVIKAIENEIFTIADKDVQTHYRALVRNKVSETFFPRREWKGDNKGGKPKVSPVKISAPRFANASLYERILLACVLNHPYIYESVEEAFGRFEISNAGLAKLREAMIGHLNQEPGLDAATLRNYLKNEGFEREMGDILSESVYVHASFSAPRADSAENYDDIVQNWTRFWQDGEQGKIIKNEMKSGWRQAFEQSDEGSEEKLREMVRAKTAEEHF